MIFFTSGLRDIKEVESTTTSAVDEALIKNKKRVLQYIKAILLESKLVDSYKVDLNLSVNKYKDDKR